jgi:sarcosine oxidase
MSTPADRPVARTDVIVIGGGVVGLAAALALGRRGCGVVLLERSSLPAAGGSSAGTARIFCPAAYPDESYLELALSALRGWREVEAAGGHQLLWSTGALTRGGFAQRELPALLRAGVEAELVSGADASGRFGVHVSDTSPLLHQPDAGIIRADRATKALAQLAAAAGVELHQHERVRSIVEQADSLEVETERRRWRCASAIVAAGPWSAELVAGLGIDLALNVSRQSVAFFDLVDPRARPVALMEFDGDEPFACWDPVRGLKAALHAQGPTADPEDGRPEIDARSVERVVDWVGASLAGIAGNRVDVETCLYSNTADERFVLERHGRIVVGSACNGQGFQFAPGTGERLAQLALEVGVDAVGV